jgi:addiction module HigA family antidote
VGRTEIEGRLPNIHPGDILREEFWYPLNLTVESCARGVQLPVDVVELLMKGEITITPDVAEHLSENLGCSAQFWLNLQKAYDDEETRRCGVAVQHGCPSNSRARVQIPSPLLKFGRWLKEDTRVIWEVFALPVLQLTLLYLMIIGVNCFLMLTHRVTAGESLMGTAAVAVCFFGTCLWMAVNNIGGMLQELERKSHKLIKEIHYLITDEHALRSSKEEPRLVLRDIETLTAAVLEEERRIMAS